MLAMSWLLSQDFICSLAYGPRNRAQIFKMNEINNVSSNYCSLIDEKKLSEFSINSLDQWKERDIKAGYNII